LYVVLIKDGSIVGAYNTNNKFRANIRAGFSLDPEIVKTSLDPGALQIKLADDPETLADWRENYLTETLAELSKINDVGLTIETDTEPFTSNEESILIEPVSIEDIEYAVNDELNDIEAANRRIGLNGLQDVTIKIINDYTPSSDEQKFIYLATQTNGKSFNDILKFSNGFLLSKLLESAVALTLNGSIEFAEILSDGSVGEKVEISAEKPEPKVDGDSLSKYVDDTLDDGSDSKMAEAIINEGLQEEDYPEHDQSNDIPIIDLPQTDDAEQDEEVQEPAQVDHKDSDGQQYDDDLSVPVLTPVDMNETVSVDQLLPQEADEDNHEDTENADPDDDSEVESMLDKVVDTADHGDNVDELVSYVEHAKQKLVELKDRKEEVDSDINDLPVEEAAKIDKEIDSLKEDRLELDRRITDLRAQKSDIDSQISDARQRRSDVDEALSHKDELEAEQAELSDKISSLESVL
jgi:hypothetical protein